MSFVWEAVARLSRAPLDINIMTNPIPNLILPESPQWLELMAYKTGKPEDFEKAALAYAQSGDPEMAETLRNMAKTYKDEMILPVWDNLIAGLDVFESLKNRFAQVDEGTFFGAKILVDASMPADEIILRNGEDIVAIINIGEDEENGSQIID